MCKQFTTMNFNTSVLIQIESNSIREVISTIDLLKNNNIPFNIIEQEKPNHIQVSEKLLHRQLGRKGLDILRLLSEGNSYQEISNKVGISIDGTRYYIKKIFKVLNVSNGREAVKIYLTQLNRF